MGKIVVISIYKSDVLDYLKEESILREDVYIACSNAEIEALKGKASKVVMLSAPMGVPANVGYLEHILLEKDEKKPDAPAPVKKPAAKAPKKAPVKKAAPAEQKFGPEEVTAKELAEGKSPISNVKGKK